jgi:hypothetical protein
MKKILVFFVFFLSASFLEAAEKSGRVGLGIGDDGVVRIFFFVNNSLSLKFGLYNSEYTVSSTTPYTRKRSVTAIEARKYFEQSEKFTVNDAVIFINEYDWFIELGYTTIDVRYDVAVDSNSKRVDTSGWAGVEYFLNDKISVDAKLGIVLYNTEYATYEVSGQFFPTTLLSLNYLFGT